MSPDPPPCARVVVASPACEHLGREGSNDVRKAYSIAFKRKMVTRLIGKDALSANELSRQSGISQGTLSVWLKEARNIHDVAKRPRYDPPPRPTPRDLTVEDKARILGEAANLSGEALIAYLQREEVKFAELERWRAALSESAESSATTGRRVRKLEREVARKDKALAEAAALLLLKKKVEDHFGVDEDDDTGERSEK